MRGETQRKVKEKLALAGEEINEEYRGEKR